MAKIRRRRRDRSDSTEATSEPTAARRGATGSGDDDDGNDDNDDNDDDDRDVEPHEDSREEPEGDAGVAPRRGRRRRSPISIAIAIAVAAVVVIALVNLTRQEAPGRDRSAAPLGADVADITLITADRNDLDCAAANGLKDFQCGFADEKTARPVDEQKRLRPFLTAKDRRLFLIPGLFLDPAIAKRFDSEPPAGKTRDQLKRFTAKCKVKVIGDLDGVKLRWAPTAAWEAAKKFPVATVSGCTVEG